MSPVHRALPLLLVLACAPRPAPRAVDLEPTLALDEVRCAPPGAPPPHWRDGPAACRDVVLRCDDTPTPPSVTLEVPGKARVVTIIHRPPSVTLEVPRSRYTFVCPERALGPRAAAAWRAETWLEIRRQQGHGALCLAFEQLARDAVSTAPTCDEAERRLAEESAKNEARQGAFAAAWARAHPTAPAPGTR